VRAVVRQPGAQLGALCVADRRGAGLGARDQGLAKLALFSGAKLGQLVGDLGTHERMVAPLAWLWGRGWLLLNRVARKGC